jgi:hypothetical protein
LDLSANVELKQLSCPDNQIRVLDLRANAKLEKVDCSNNQISDIEQIYYLVIRFGSFSITPQQPPAYADYYSLNVIKGSGNGFYESGKTVKIIADPPGAGKAFDRWVTAGGGSFSDATSPYTVFTMPDANVTVTATYKAKPAEQSGVANKETDAGKGNAISIVTMQVAALPAVQWSGKQIRPLPSVKTGSRTLTEGSDYILSYGANKNIGKGSVTITGTGSYAGSKTLNFNIVPKKMSVSKLSIAGRKATATWKKAAGAQKVTKLQLSYRIKGSKKWKLKNISNAGTKYTVKKLKKGKRYQFRIRAYKSVGGKKYYGSWSKVKTSRKVK